MKRHLFILILALTSTISYTQTFSDVTDEAGINHLFNVGDRHFGGGVAILDYDNDGFEDFYITGGTNSDKLYRNNGDGTFTDNTAFAGFDHLGLLLTQGVIAGDIDNDGFRDLFISVRCSTADLNKYHPNLMYRNNGDGTFSNITSTCGIASDTAFSTSSTFLDFNQDGYLDLYVGNYIEPNFYEIYDTTGENYDPPVFDGKANYFYLNNGDNTFSEISEIIGVADTGHALAVSGTDFDNDHDIDIYLANDFGWDVPNALFRNEFPIADFSDIRVESGTNAAMNAMGVAIGDYDEDGNLDYYITDWLDNILYNNNGDGTFTDMAYESGTDDTYLIMEGGYFCLSYTPDEGFIGFDTAYYEVCGLTEDCFTNMVVFTVGLPPIGSGISELAVFPDQSAQVCAMFNDTIGEPASLSIVQNPNHGVIETFPGYGSYSISWGAFFFDFDNDSYLDLYVSNGVLTPFGSEELYNPNSLFKNLGNGNFDDISIESGTNNEFMGRGAVQFDFDNDGDLDILLAVVNYPDDVVMETTPNAVLLRNDLTGSQNWLKVKVHGNTNNKDGLGTRLNAYVDGRKFIREIDGGSSFLSHNSIIAHFGLADYLSLDSLEAIFPGGCRHVLYDVEANQLLEIEEGMLYSNLPDSIELCAGDSMLLSPGTGSEYSYSWNNGLTMPTITVEPEVTTTFSVIATDAFGCQFSDETIVIVNPIPTVTFEEAGGPYTTLDPPFLLNGFPPEGFFSGNGVLENLFLPEKAGPGSHKIVYTYTSPQGCTDSASRMIEVTELTYIEDHEWPPHIKVFPNPTSHYLNIESSDNSNPITEVALLELGGKQLKSFHPRTPTTSIKFDLGNVSPGIYLLKIENGDSRYFKKIIKH